MDEWADAHPGLLPVQGMRAGDHAFLGHDDDEADRDALVTCTRTGPARGGKVIVFAAPQLDPEPRILHADDSVRIAGEADHATREPFVTALRDALGRAAGSRLLVDLVSLRFLGVRCALYLIDLIGLVDHGRRIAGAFGHGGAEVRRGAAQAVLLRRPGSGGVRRLTLTEVVREW